MNELAVFAGGGGGLLGTRLLGWRTVCYVERNPYAVEILKARIRDGYLDDAPIWDDAETFDGRPWSGLVDIVTAGFPCQPFSGAGKQLGENDPRNMWPATVRILRQIRPRYAFLENVPSLLSPVRGNPAYFGRVLGDLVSSGYDCVWDCVPAAAVGAPHLRDRVWILAYSNRSGLARTRIHSRSREKDEAANDAGRDRAANPDTDGRRREESETQQSVESIVFERGIAGEFHSNVSDSNRDGCDQVEQSVGAGTERESFVSEVAERCGSGAWWEIEPAVGRVVNGVAHRVDRLEAIGNGQVPAVVACVWNALMQRSNSQ